MRRKKQPRGRRIGGHSHRQQPNQETLGRRPQVATPPKDRRERGREGEEIALRYLKTLEGWEILAQNVYYRAGELDIVASCGDVLVFVEVRGRWTNRGPRAEDSITRTKQRRLTLAALLWLQANPAWRTHRARFDVMAVDLRYGCVAAHHRAAFEAAT